MKKLVIGILAHVDAGKTTLSEELLYLCGEILDVDGICGGYNLQWAWATGYLAGTAAANDISSDR